MSAICARFKHNRVPVLLMVGERDHPERMKELQGAMPNSTFKVIPGAGVLVSLLRRL